MGRIHEAIDRRVVIAFFKVERSDFHALLGMQRIEYGLGRSGWQLRRRAGISGGGGGGGVDGEICCAFIGLAFINNRR